MNIVSKSFVCAAAMLLPVAAHAAPVIPGSSISFNGFVTGSGGSSLSGSTSLDFISPAISYAAGTGSFATSQCFSGTCGTIEDLANLVVGAQSIANFISLSGGTNADPIDFTLTGISSIGRTADELNFVATGLLSNGSLGPTPAQFLFTAQGGQTTSFSGTLLAGAVPEASTWALMTLGIGALGMALRRRSAKQRTTLSYA